MDGFEDEISGESKATRLHISLAFRVWSVVVFVFRFIEALRRAGSARLPFCIDHGIAVGPII